MATVTVLSASHHRHLPSSMASKRVPLANNPNAANSPCRGATATAAAAAVGGKRSRPTTQDLKDADETAQSPPKKRQLLDHIDCKSHRLHNAALDDKEGRVFGPRPENTPPTAFQKKLVAASRESKQREVRVVAEQKADSETIKQWRRHYRKVFPSFVFYLESLPQDVCIRCSRQITTLGAREEKFFSKAVTHIVTNRAIPPPLSEAEATAARTSSSSKQDDTLSNSSHAHTINPSLLDKNADVQVKGSSQQPKARNASEYVAQKRPQSALHQSSNADILVRAREMGIKIWPLEKFERMMHAIFEAEQTNSEEGQAARKPHAVKTANGQDKDLSQLLKNEKNLPGERPPWTGITPFQGFYIYVHDIDEKTRPVMVRDYPKVDKEEGEWPQFRCVPAPKCPFIPDESASKREERSRQQRPQKDEADKSEKQPRTRAAAAAAMEAPTEAKPEKQPDKASLVIVATAAPAAPAHQQESKPEPLRETDNNSRSMPKPSTASTASTTKTIDPPPLKHTDSLPPQLTNRFQVPNMPRPGAGREPMASGLQRSNQTSAIRSQVISSTAANPTARAGVSKEMHQLQRRAVEHRHRATNSVTSVSSSYMNDVRAAINDDHVPKQQRQTRRKPVEQQKQQQQQQLAKIQEDETQSDEEEKARPLAKITRAPKKKAVVSREPKPGYCENCRDKYDDFNEHIISKKHRKFALAMENWTELDSLLTQLVRR